MYACIYCQLLGKVRRLLEWADEPLRKKWECMELVIPLRLLVLVGVCGWMEWMIPLLDCDDY